MIYVVLERHVPEDDLQNALAKLFGIESDQILMDKDFETEWYNHITDDIRLLCHFMYHPHGQFQTRIEAIPFDSLKPAFNVQEAIVMLGEILNCAILSDYNCCGVFEFVMVRKNGNFSRVYVDPDFMYDEVTDIQFHIEYKILNFFLSQSFSNETLQVALSQALGFPKEYVAVSSEFFQLDQKPVAQVEQYEGDFLQCVRVKYPVKELSDLPSESDVELVQKICQHLNCHAGLYGIQYDLFVSPSGEHRTVQIFEGSNEQQTTVTVTDVNT